jgi:hypothetical protein
MDDANQRRDSEAAGAVIPVAVVGATDTDAESDTPFDLPEPAYTQQQVDEVLAQLHAEQNFARGLAAGAVAALIGAAVWAAFTAATKYQIGWMAIGVGALVGVAIRHFGRGMEPRFGVAGAALSLLGCMIGNVLAICAIAAIEFDIGFLEVVGTLDAGTTIEIVTESFQAMDLLFYGLALYFGYKYSFVQVTEDDLAVRLAALPPRD